MWRRQYRRIKTLKVAEMEKDTGESLHEMMVNMMKIQVEEMEKEERHW